MELLFHNEMRKFYLRVRLFLGGITENLGRSFVFIGLLLKILPNFEMLIAV